MWFRDLLWIDIRIQSAKFQVSRLLWATSSSTFRKCSWENSLDACDSTKTHINPFVPDAPWVNTLDRLTLRCCRNTVFPRFEGITGKSFFFFPFDYLLNYPLDLALMKLVIEKKYFRNEFHSRKVNRKNSPLCSI